MQSCRHLQRALTFMQPRMPATVLLLRALARPEVSRDRDTHSPYTVRCVSNPSSFSIIYDASMIAIVYGEFVCLAIGI